MTDEITPRPGPPDEDNGIRLGNDPDLGEKRQPGEGICGVVSASGPNGEPLACGYVYGHYGKHSWATLPTFPVARENCGTGEPIEDPQGRIDTLTAQLEDAQGGVIERLKDELRAREKATTYEVEIFVVGEWRTANRTPHRNEAKNEGQRLSAERLAGPEPDYVRVVGHENVFDNIEATSQIREQRRNRNYGDRPPTPHHPV